MAEAAKKDDGFLHIPDSLGRDLDNGKADNRPVEDFISDDTLQAMKDQQEAPVRMDNLVPMSKQEAARRTTFDGESLPKFPATRRVIPAPFQRARVTGGKHGKTWGPLVALLIREGDIITGVGLVTDVRREVRVMQVGDFVEDGSGEFPPMAPVAVGWNIVVTGAGGNVMTWNEGAEIQVFRKHGLWMLLTTGS